MKNLVKISLFALAIGVFASCGAAEDAADATTEAVETGVEATTDVVEETVDGAVEGAETMVDEAGAAITGEEAPAADTTATAE